MNNKPLHEIFDGLTATHRADFFPRRVSEYICANLKETYTLRPYQKEALGRFCFFLESYPDRPEQNPHLLFHMATGSGKTLIMAAAILYLYRQGYRNFIFFVNSTNIIEKTRENFLNPLSSKYLFAPQIIFGTQQVHLREVDNFQTPAPNSINIIFTTIQGLHTRLNAPRENTLTYEDFENQRIVLISDEAHHINALTKSRLGKTEAEEARTWEYTVNKIFTTHADNLLLEFTATIDTHHPAIRAKYADKILYEYSLRKFRQDGYAKDVKVLQADMAPIDRALQAVILSQYRRKVAEKYGIHIKPVILMKSRIIADSETIEAEFHTAIRKLTPAKLRTIKAGAGESIIRRAFTYFKAAGITLENLIRELQEDFSPAHCLSVNSKSDSEEKQLLVNSLEDRHNPIRVIFAVNKLNEGWDVLNLFDIVRLYNTRDATRGHPGKTTIAEAQLIGRGARYYPFRLDSSQPLFQRKFDDDLTHELRVLETLHYHSAHNPRYIQELRQALIKTGMMPPRTEEIRLTVKPSFKKSDFWNEGIIFLNRKIRNPRTHIIGLTDISITKHHSYHLRTGRTRSTAIFGTPTINNRATVAQTLRLPDLGAHVIRKAINKLPFYRFNNLQRYFPHLPSITQFITGANYLRQIEVEIHGTVAQLKNLTAEEKLAAAIHVLTRLSREISTATADYIGSPEFFPHAIKDLVKDKVLHIVIDENSDPALGIPVNNLRDPMRCLDLSQEDWYIYNENYGTAEENGLVKFIRSAMVALKKRYQAVYLLRNAHLFQIHRFSDGRAMEPDFVLFLIEEDGDKRTTHQLFIEAKRSRLLKTDGWQESFLLEIDKSVIYENQTFKLIGLSFYNETEQKSAFEATFAQFLPICS